MLPLRSIRLGRAVSAGFRLIIPEPLEHRRMLSVATPGVEPDNAPPRVEGIFLNGSSWSPTFRAELEEEGLGSAQYGFETEGRNAESTEGFRGSVVPWLNVDQISIQFSEDVQVQQDDLVITGVNQTAYGTATFAYDPDSHVAIWTLGTPIRNDIITLELDGTSEAGVTDLAGNPLQGNCSEGGGDGSGGEGEGGNPGRDHCEAIAILTGDATRDGRVNALDLADVRRRLNTRATDSSSGTGNNRYSVFSDVNADGVINALDLALVRQRLNTQLPDRDDNSGEN